ncbi:MAG: SLC13 family permease [Verrucomicrobiales bacterium]
MPTAPIPDHILVYLLLAFTLGGFLWGRIRYDLVALLALIAAVLLGLVPAENAFAGFGHPAVITVAAVLVLSQGFLRSGLVDLIAAQAMKVGGRPTLQILTLAGSVAVMSAFMNNVGALALMLPVAIRMARENGNPPSLLLMPLAFGSLLGGLMTLIGTPPNIIIATFRGQTGNEEYGMFDFLPVGGVVLVVGLVFLTLFGWRLAPKRKEPSTTDELFAIADYLSELQVVEKSDAKGWTLGELRERCEEIIAVVAVMRGERRIPVQDFNGTLREGDVVLVEADPDHIKDLARKGGLKISGEAFSERLSEAKDLEVVEAVVKSDSPMIQRSVEQLRLLDRYGLYLLAVAREGGRLKKRLKEIRFRVGDVLLLQGGGETLKDSLHDLGCLPLAKRDLSIGQPRRLLLSVALFAVAVAATMLGWLPPAVALTAAALLSILTGVLPLREVYTAIDWPVIVLLGALIPIGASLETSGGADLIARGLFAVTSQWSAVISLAALFLITMALSNVINNVAAAVLMAPIAISLAAGFEASADPFLMAVAISASCAFLTPIGHQSNTLVMGPGGYRFGDYWRMGLPLSLLVLVTAIPVIVWVWPL